MATDDERANDIPITVIGGYLGAGKTTLLNRLLREADGRRLGVIVNDFGSIGIDAELLSQASESGVVTLPNGCICCSLGNDLLTTLTTLRSLDQPPEQIVIEASGIADPATAAAWGTSAGFSPGGVIVLAAADTISRQVNDRYVSTEVRRQLAGADLVVLTKVDTATPDEQTAARATLVAHAPGVAIADSTLPADGVLGLRLDAGRGSASRRADEGHVAVGYQRWSWSGGRVARERIDGVGEACGSVLRLKALLDVGEHHVEVHVVGGRTTMAAVSGLRPGSRAEAVAHSDDTVLASLASVFDALVG